MSLYLTILFTSIFCILALLPICLTINNRISEIKKNTNTENEISKGKRPLFLLDERNLQSQPMFWTAIALPLIAGVFLFAKISPNYDLNFTLSSYKTFMEIAQLPSVILALSPIFGAFVVYAHRSYQTDIQIKTAEKQLIEAQKKNKVDMYFSRRKFIVERLEKLNINFSNKINNANYIYDKFYSFNDYLDDINTDRYMLINKKIEEIYEKINIIECYSNSIKHEKILKREIHSDILLLLKSSLSMLKITAIPLKKNLDIKRVTKEFTDKYDEYVSDLALKSYLKEEIDELQPMLKSFLDDFRYELNVVKESLRELFTVLLLEKNVEIYLPHLNKLNFEYGDKVATENQNNHE
ncbi:hypothetical protein [Proteus vulgaris]|uniref:hypothetical protein n=1 Tax=Proteus vulgaris TaxID=585 RepID=UPI003457BB3C